MFFLIRLKLLYFYPIYSLKVALQFVFSFLLKNIFVTTNKPNANRNKTNFVRSRLTSPKQSPKR